VCHGDETEHSAQRFHWGVVGPMARGDHLYVRVQTQPPYQLNHRCPAITFVLVPFPIRATAGS
jgi:hypothetical protein